MAQGIRQNMEYKPQIKNYKKLKFHFCEEFLLSTRRLPAAARKGAGSHFATFSKMGITGVHRVRAVRGNNAVIAKKNRKKHIRR